MSVKKGDFQSYGAVCLLTRVLRAICTATSRVDDDGYGGLFTQFDGSELINMLQFILWYGWLLEKRLDLRLVTNIVKQKAVEGIWPLCTSWCGPCVKDTSIPMHHKDNILSLLTYFGHFVGQNLFTRLYCSFQLAVRNARYRRGSVLQSGNFHVPTQSNKQYYIRIK